MKSPEKSGSQSDKRLPYEPPRIESESIFEQNALACGKCRTVSHRQHACMRLPSTS